LKEAALVRIEPAEAGADPARAAADPAVPAWRDAVASAHAALAEARKRTASVRFVVSDHFVRYLVLAWDSSLASEAERNAYLRHHFESVYGPRAADWNFTFDRDGEGPSRVAVAMDRGLVDALCGAAAGAGLGLAAVEPLAVAAFNRLRGQLAAPACFFVVREPGRLTSLLVDQGAPRSAASQRTADAGARALAGLLAAEAIDAGIAHNAPMAVCVAEWAVGAAAPAPTRTAELRDLVAASAAQAAPA
jgi:hypothetical protein